MFLPNVVDEVNIVHGCFQAVQAKTLSFHSAHTSPDELLSLLKVTSANVLHMACHGVQDSDPLKSSFRLRDGDLSIEDIMQLNLPNAVLAFLSACYTARGNRNAPDQAVHLAASMLFCGFRSVIGTMWYVTRRTPMTRVGVADSRTL
jgi:CHAT domain-containing protein